jgi:glycosyltransferase involved in cell wall biosynthesis
MFESTRLPADWADTLNNMAAVVVPSKFCRDIFWDSGVNGTPIHVVPLGVSEIYQPAVSRQDRPLTFLAFLDRGARKGGIIALQAFVTAFGESMDYRLILKGRHPKVPIQFTNPNIEVVQADLTEEEMRDLYHRADVLINPHKGEGFGMIPREAAACGCIVLTTGWSGTVDDLPEWGWPLPYTLEPADWKGAKNLEGQSLGEWAAPDLKGVVTALRDVAAHRDEYWWQAQVNAKNIRRLYSWRAFSQSVLEIWKEVASAHVIAPTAASDKSALHSEAI